MANLSQYDRTIITKNPLNDSLDHLRDVLRKAEQSYDATDGDSDPKTQEAASRLLGALLLSEAAGRLTSRTGNGDIASDLFRLRQRVQKGDFNYEYYRALVQLVIQRSSDFEIWNSVFNLITIISRLTPPTSIAPQSRLSFTSSYQQTPHSFNTGGFEDTSEHRKQVDDALKQELFPSLRIDIPGFINAVFGHVPRLDEIAETVFDLCQKGDAPLYKEGIGWAGWPRNAEEEFVLEWLQDLMKSFTAWINERGIHAAARRQIYKGPGIYLDGSTAKRKMDVGIMAYHGDGKGDENINDLTPSWTQILVAGELKCNPVEDAQNPAWVDLATYAREVFHAQNRRFVLGFTLCGSMMRLWLFDRSGSSGSFSFDINQDGFKFTRVMLGYFLMNHEQLGLDPTIQQSDGKRYMEVTRNGKIDRLILTENIRTQAVIVGRATTCWRVYRDGDESKQPLVVKDSWQYEERPEEGELIKEATDKGVRNIARYYHHETVQVGGKNDDTLENVRKGLMKTCGRTTFRQRSFKEPELLTSESLGKAMAGKSSLLRKRSSSAAEMAPPPANNKRSRSSRRSKDTGTPTHNRVHRRVITKDAGKPIHKASSPVAIINGIIGAICGHESLLNAGILHRDISIGNIMLTEKEDDGFLIDLDLANKTSDNQASGAPSKTGTKIFMAIGALLGEPHSFMHDLESFFWVLFWICIHYDSRNEKGEVKRRVVPEYEKWNYAGTEELAKTKAGQISKGIFDTVDDYITERCKPLIPCLKELHKVVFVGGSRWFSEHRELYSDMKRILEKARDNIKAETVG